MDKENLQKVEAEIAFKNVAATQAINQELNDLRPNPHGIKANISNVIFIGILFYSISLFDVPSGLYPVFALVLTALIGVQSSLQRDNIRTNRRIDLLLKIIREQKSKERHINE